MTLTQKANKNLTKAATAEAVDDEVQGRICDDEKVTESLEVEEDARTGEVVSVEGTGEHLRHHGRCLRHDEYHDNDDQHESDVIL